MEERIKFLEERINTLAIACAAQQETISEILKCVGHIETFLERDAKIDSMLFEYCKKLRREVETIKGESLSI